MMQINISICSFLLYQLKKLLKNGCFAGNISLAYNLLLYRV